MSSLVEKRARVVRGSAAMLAVAAIAAAWVGCGQTAPETPVTPATPDQAASSVAANDPPFDRELWNACYIQGSKVGYEHTTFSRLQREGRPVVRIEGLVHLTIKRFQDVTESEIRFWSLETPDGKLLEFEGQVGGSSIPLVTKGRVHGDRLEVQTVTRGKTLTTSSRWLPEYGGFFAVEQSLERKPMQPDERRKVHALLPGTDQVVAVELAAGAFETVKLLGGSYELLRIDSALTLPGGQSLTETLWADRTGGVLRRRSEAMNLESFRVPKAVALEKPEGAGFDLGKDLSVPVDRVIVAPHDTKRVRYRLHLDGADPAGTFVSGYSQQVRSIDPHTAEVTVYAVRPGGSAGNTHAPDDPPADEDRAANNLIQSDNAKIVAIAQETAGQEKDPWKVALALEGQAKKLITKKDYSQAFASAAEVIETGVGDCTEHSVLLAALARARGIPARVAIGLVYLEQDGKGSFGYHMWNELYIGTRWIPMDSTLARGGIGAAHLKIAHTSLQGASAFSSFLPVASVAGRLKIQIEQME